MQTEIMELIIHLPITERIETIEKISRSAREDLLESNTEQGLSDDKKTAYFRLRGALKMKNPPMTKEEVREICYEHLSEKYK